MFTVTCLNLLLVASLILEGKTGGNQLIDRMGILHHIAKLQISSMRMMIVPMIYIMYSSSMLEFISYWAVCMGVQNLDCFKTGSNEDEEGSRR